LHFGFNLSLFPTREYKWITNGQKEPVITITTSVIIGNFEVITNIVYRDSVHPVISGIEPAPAQQTPFSLYPNPATDYVNIVSPENLDGAVLTITDVTGKTVLSKPLQQLQQTINTINWAPGVYMAVVTDAQGGRVVRKFEVQ
ncbi:MAG TPA: T9SS type A sorting domain-containing protein, partial [Chitinophagales bacterium]|nr:T9SS type A sorting domain-containing protein [Chitinophagales bacterium]